MCKFIIHFVGAAVAALGGGGVHSLAAPEASSLRTLAAARRNFSRNESAEVEGVVGAAAGAATGVGEPGGNGVGTTDTGDCERNPGPTGGP